VLVYDKMDAKYSKLMKFSQFLRSRAALVINSAEDCRVSSGILKCCISKVVVWLIGAQHDNRGDTKNVQKFCEKLPKLNISDLIQY
jgi:hypothetical protein